jgi:hypothetical protein
MEFTADEMVKLKAHMERTLKCTDLLLKKRDKVNDSVEVMASGEFVGVIYKIIDEGETSYNFEMAILDIDLI